MKIMSHPWTSESIGYRVFEGTQFSELQFTDWEFDGTESDVRKFVEQELCAGGFVITSVELVCDGTYDVLLSSGEDCRIYTIEDH
jgi:hypothetical protein